MAPSHHLRSTLGILIGATLALSSCGNQATNAAAIVNGTVISDQDVQTVYRQLRPLAPAETSRSILLTLILAPYVGVEADRAGKSITDTQVIKVIGKVDAPSPAMVDFVRMRLAAPSLDQPSKTRIVNELGKAEININPRYGTFDITQFALVPISPNWIKASATPEAK